MKKKSEVSMDTKLQLDSLFNKRKYSFGEKKHSHLFVSDANSIDILFILKHEADLLIYTKEAGRGTSYKIYLIEKNVQAVKKYYSFRKSDNITGIKQFLIDNLIYCQ